ncbi:MAG: hypothetical protein IPP64_09425 [Bacteroidetes bacterium]|nr:hypothetical protein [Bacteroidota bacterium]
MKKIVLLVFILIATKAISQEHWEDNFWREEGKKRYAKTLTMAGLYTAFYDNGKIKWQGKCLENGTPDSVWVYFDKEGNKLWEGEYTGNYYEYKKYFDYDSEDNYKQIPRWDTSIIGNYQNGLKNGEWQEYDYNGKYIKKKGQFVNGEPTGIWLEFEEHTKQTIERKVTKCAEYNYATQTRILFKRDSINGSTHIDSLNYASQYGLTGHGRQNNYHTNDAINLCFLGTFQYINFSSLNNYFHQPNYNKIDSPLKSVGIELSARAIERMYWSFYANWTPAVSLQANDSIRLRLSGSSYTLNLGIDLFYKNEFLDLSPTVGLGFQQLKLKVLKTQNPDSTAFAFNEGDYRVYRNSAPTLNAMLNFRMNLGVFSFNISGGYLLDCSSSKWRYNGKLLSNSPKTSLSSPFVIASIGFHLYNGDSSDE